MWPVLHLAKYFFAHNLVSSAYAMASRRICLGCATFETIARSAEAASYPLEWVPWCCVWSQMVRIDTIRWWYHHVKEVIDFDVYVLCTMIASSTSNMNCWSTYTCHAHTVYVPCKDEVHRSNNVWDTTSQTNPTHEGFHSLIKLRFPNCSIQFYIPQCHSARSSIVLKLVGVYVASQRHHGLLTPISRHGFAHICVPNTITDHKQKYYLWGPLTTNFL